MPVYLESSFQVWTLGTTAISDVIVDAWWDSFCRVRAGMVRSRYLGEVPSSLELVIRNADVPIDRKIMRLVISSESCLARPHGMPAPRAMFC